MIVAAHQPNFMPWFGYFDKMRKADLFVSVDHVQLERQSYQTRARIKTGSGPRWITVPVLQNSRGELIKEKRIDNSREGRFRWGRKMFLTLKYAYQSAPYFSAWEKPLSEIFETRWESLAALNERIIAECRTALEIRTPIVHSSELDLAGAKSDLVLDLCRKTGADAYLAGSGASRSYLGVPAFERAGIRVLWQEFEHPRYVQHPLSDTFIEKLSIFDLLFNCGPRSADFFRTMAAPAQSDVFQEITSP